MFSNNSEIFAGSLIDGSKLLKSVYSKSYPFAHSVVPCHNLHLEPDINELLHAPKELKYCISYNTPVFSPSHVDIGVVNGLDRIHNIVLRKAKWKHVRDMVLKKCDSRTLNVEIGSGSEDEVHPCFAVLAQHLENDPDPYFDSTYNWYYSGICRVTKLNNEDYLIRSGEHKIFVVELQSTEVEVSLTIQLDEPSPVYQIDTNKNIILVRQRSRITIYQLSLDGSQLKRQNCIQLENEVPFVHASLNQFSEKKFCSLSYKAQLYSWKFKKREIQQRDSYSCAKSEDGWGCVHYHNEDQVVYCNRTSVFLIDLTRSELIREWPLKGVVENCDRIYCAAKGSRLHYITTRHHLLALNVDSGWTQRWTHCSPVPSLMAILSPEPLKFESIFVGSQMCDTVVYIENQYNPQSDNFCSLKHPYSLPSLVETLHKSRTRGICLSPLVTCRFNTSLTGLSCVRRGDEITVFRCTGPGDVFCQTMIPSERLDALNEMTDAELERLQIWEKECLEEYEKGDDYMPSASCIMPLDHLSEYFDQSQKTQDQPTIVEKTEKMQSWNISKKKMLQFKDQLASKLLQVWDIENDEEWYTFEEDSTPNVDSEESSSDDNDQRIVEWLMSHAINGGSDDGNGK